MSGQALEFFEIDLPYCALDYGVAPCTASIPTTGAAKCFNTRATCQDTANFDPETVTLRLAKPTDYLPRDIDILGPWIRSIDYTPGVISLGENLGTRAVLKVVSADYPHSDAGDGLDKYQSERGYDPYVRGSFWPRFRARHPSLNGVECRWIIGFVGQTLAEMETRTFFIESFDGPAADGSFTITAKDVLKFLDGDRAQAPVLSSGSLSAGINDSVTAATLVPSGIGDAEYPSGDPDYYVAPGGSEIVKVTARAGNALTIVRAQLGSVAKSHSAGDRVQLVIHYAAMDAADILYQHITNYSDLPADYITLADWQAETAAFLGTVYTFTITEPTSVAAFVSRVIQQAGLMMWDDPLAKKLRLKVIRAVPVTAATIDESSVIGRTFEPSDQPEQRVSRAWVHYAINDPTKRRDDLDNYRSTAKAPEDDADAVESEALYGAPAIKKITADGISTGGGAVALKIGNILVGRKRRAPRRFKFSQFRGQAVVPVLGGGFYLSWRSLQDASGERELVPVQIVSFKPGPAILQAVGEEMRFTDIVTSTDKTIPIDLDAYNINLRTIYDQVYAAPQSGDTLLCEILEGVIIGSTSTSLPAFDLGSWPSDSTTGKRTSGSPIITDIPDTSDYTPGMYVQGAAGIPAGAKILTVDSATQITLDVDATSGASTTTALTIFLVIITLGGAGRIQAAAGVGGRGGNGTYSGGISAVTAGSAGTAGGTALYTRYAFALQAANLEIFGGGGGGGGGAGVLGPAGASGASGGGGGGGRGQNPGTGGAPGTGTDATGSSGASGTSESPGLGGAGASPSGATTSGNGGQGGTAGAAGTAGNPSVSPDPAGEEVGGAGGAAGNSIDGVSYVDLTTGPGSILGPQIN